MKENKLLAFGALTLAGLFWGLGFPLGKLALREVGPAHLMLWRFAAASLAGLPFAFRHAATRALFRSPVVLAAGACLGIASVVQFEGLAHVTVTLAALLVGVLPSLVAITAWAGGDHVTRASWIGVIAATIGAGLIAGKPGGSGSPLGIGLTLASLPVLVAWLGLLHRAPRGGGPMAMPAVTVIVATVVILPIALILSGPPPIHLSTITWGEIAGQGLLSNFLATAAWAYGAARVDTASAGVFINIEPLMGPVIGIGLFGEPLSPTLLIGGVLIVLGSLIVVRGERSTPAFNAPAAAGHGLPTEKDVPP